MNRKLKIIFCFLVGTITITYLALMLLTSLPAFQTWGAGVASKLLTEKLGADVNIARLRLNMLGQVILDNVELYDQRDTLMLRASRIAAKVDLVPLVNKKIRISGAQLIGAKAKLYKDGDAPCNFQFLIDAFSSKDTTSNSLNLGIGAVVVRKGDIRFDRLDKPVTLDKFNPNHLHVSNLNLTARVLAKMPDTLTIDLRDLSFQEESGLRLQHLSFELTAGHHDANIRNLALKLSETTITAKVLSRPTSRKNTDDRKFSPFNGNLEGSIAATICPRDLSCFVPQFKTFDSPINLSAEARFADGNLYLSDIIISDKANSFSLCLDATISDTQGSPAVYANIKELLTSPSIQQFLTQNLQGQAREISPLLTRLGSTKTSGSFACEGDMIRANIQTESDQGSIKADATLRNTKEVWADITATDIKLGHLLNLSDKGNGTAMSLVANVEGTLPGKNRLTKLSLEGMLTALTFNSHEHRNIPFSAEIDGDTYRTELAVEEPDGTLRMQLQTGKEQGRRSMQCKAEVSDFAPYNMNLTKGYEGERFSADIDADFDNIDPNRLQGRLQLRGVELTSEKEGNLKIGNIGFTSDVEEDGMHLRMESDFLKMRADGSFNWSTIASSLMKPIKQNLPDLPGHGNRQSEPDGNDFRFAVQIQDTLLAERLLGSDLRLPAWSRIDGSISDATGQIAMELYIPQLSTAGWQLQNISCRAEAGSTALQTSLQCERIMKGKPVEINLDAYASDGKVTSRLRWDNKRNAAQTGDISTTGTIRRDPSGQTAIDARVNPSNIVIADTLWHIKPATIKYHDGVIDVGNLSVSQGERHINIGGRISGIDTDTLKAELADIDISYIMDLVNFHSVDFDGKATGNIFVGSLMKKPRADAFLQVKDFTFNEADLGNMNLHANWGNRAGTVLLEADIKGPIPQHSTQIRGTIIPGRGEEDGLNLNVETECFNLAFLKKYTKKVFHDLQGRTSGKVRIFGPFKKVNLEGNMLINDMKMHLPALGTDYHLAGDSVTLRPDNIWIRGAHVYDHRGIPGTSGHTAILDAHLTHNNLKKMRFDINIDASNLLCYNFPLQMDRSFCGTAYADAKVHLYSIQGGTAIDVKATPTAETVLTYNVASPGTVSETEFVTYVNHDDNDNENNSNRSQPSTLNPQPSTLNPQPSTLTPQPSTLTPPTSSDLRINFDINANPNAQIRLLMDSRTGDNISLRGNGQLMANYYNKGRFQLFGTYRVSDGTYNMSIRDLIHKDFTFQPDGTIVFGGDAMQAALNLTAKHTIPNVSLNDISTTEFGLSNTRVDCIMNIGGIVENPTITFDFDIPNASEDEKQMVRSLLSSEEERDMQTMYLLGVGRFYTYGTLIDKGQTKGTMAMNSVLSSALSSRFNQIMSQALGGSNWSFGTNLQTGEEGWEHVDVEGSLSGKMLSGRLMFNGSFGYRENKYKMGGNNFIGDFDIQYRLSPRSPFSLKAYNQTNDRYFTQSSLTTQGIGIKFQRNFSRFLELFRSVRE